MHWIGGLLGAMSAIASTGERRARTRGFTDAAHGGHRDPRGMRNRLVLPLALTALAAAALALPAGGAGVTIPKGIKTAKVTQYPVTIDAVGYLDHTWTWDTTKPCSPGSAKTIDESLTFELGRPKAAKVSVVNGKVILFPVTGGDATLETELSNWRTTNYCPPTDPLPEPPEPVCTKKLKGKVGVGITPVKEEGGEDDPAPLVRQTQVSVFRVKATPQTVSCQENRPAIKAESEATKGWHAEPQVGIAAPLGATDWQFVKLKVGETLRRTVRISGGCGRVSFGAGASAVSPYIRSCVIKGKVVVIVKRTGSGFSTY